MIPLAVYPDAVAAGIDALSDGLAGRAEDYAQGVTFDVQRPATAAVLPVVQVAKDGDRITHPVVSRTLLRVTAWHVGQAQAHDLAQLCQAILLSHTGPDIAGCFPSVGPLGDADPDTGTDFCTFLVNASLKARTL